MSTLYTSRLDVPYPNPNNLGPPDGPAQMEAIATVLDGAVVYGQGALAARPEAGIEGRLYFVTGDATAANNGILWWDTGAAWDPVNGNPRVTALPGSPTDLQTVQLDLEALYPSNAAFLGIVWQCTYRAATEYWDAHGAAVQFPLGSGTAPANTYETLTTLDAPREGDYNVTVTGGTVVVSSGGSGSTYTAVLADVGGTGLSAAIPVEAYPQLIPLLGARVSAAAAGNAISIQGGFGSPGVFANVTGHLSPIRLK